MEIDKQSKNFFKKPLFLLMMAVIFSVGGFFIYEAGYSLEVNFNGDVIGYVKSEETINEALDFVEGEVAIVYGEDAYFDKEVSFQRVRNHKDDEINKNNLGNKISSAINVYKPATVLLIDGEKTVVVESEDVANKMLDLIKAPYLTNNYGSKVLDVFIHQEIAIENRDVLANKIIAKEDIFSAFEKGEEADVANVDDVTVANLSYNLNQINIQKKSMFDLNDLNIDVITIIEEVEVESIDFETVEEADSTMYKGISKVKQEGVKGEKQFTYNTTLINGEKIKSEKISEEVTIEPVDKIVAVGSKVRPIKVVSNPSYNGDKARGAVSVAWTQVNNRVPYVFGGSSPRGFDCSGLTSYVYRQVGVYLPHSATAQANYGSAVSKSNLMPGDLVFFRGVSGAGIGHAGIYIGNGQMIHAPYAGKPMQVVSINSSYFAARYVTARRVA